MPVDADRHQVPDPDDDAELAVAVGRGDRGAFAAVYDRYAERIYALAQRHLGDREAATDVTTETFFVLTRRPGGPRDPRRLRPWLFALALAAMQRDPSGATRGLDDQDRLLLDLHDREQLAGADLADAIGVRPESIDRLLSRARGRLGQDEADLPSVAVVAAAPGIPAAQQMRSQVMASFDAMVAGGANPSATPSWAKGAWRGDGFPQRSAANRARLPVAVLAGAVAVLLVGGTGAAMSLLPGGRGQAPVAAAASATGLDRAAGLATVGGGTAASPETAATPVSGSTDDTTGSAGTSGAPSTAPSPGVSTSGPATGTAVTSPRAAPSTTAPNTALPRTTTPSGTAPRTTTPATTVPRTTASKTTAPRTTPVPPPAAGALTASEFSRPLGVPKPKSGTFTLTNSSSAPVAWLAVSSVSGLLVVPAIGQLAAGKSVKVAVAVDPTTDVWPGEPVETVTVRGGGSPVVVEIPHAVEG